MTKPLALSTPTPVKGKNISFFDRSNTFLPTASAAGRPVRFPSCIQHYRQKSLSPAAW